MDTLVRGDSQSRGIGIGFRTLALAILAGVSVFALATPANAAAAGNIKPANLPGCTDGATASAGGWDDRQFIGGGTNDESWGFQIRPRTVTLAEPCVTSGNFTVPYTVDDLPTEGSYFDGGSIFRICSDGSSADVCVSIVDMVKNNTDGTNRWTMCFRAEPTSSAAIALAFDARVTIPGLTTLNVTATNDALSSYYPTAGKCGDVPTAQRAYALIVSDSYPTPTWDRIRIINGAGNAYLSSAGTPMPSFWGATQGAPMTVGGGAAAETVVTCASYASASGSTHGTNTAYDNISQEFLPQFEPDDDDYEHPIWEATGVSSLSIPVAGCDYVVSVKLSVCSWNADYEKVCLTGTWTADRYEQHPEYVEDDATVAMCKLYPSNPNCEGIELEIKCEIEYSDPGNPITSIGDFLGGLSPWIGCMVIPQGWDREGLIAREFEASPVYQVAYAVNSAMPDGLVCGPVGTMPMLDGSQLELNTCAMDVLDSGLKNVIGYTIVLGIGGLIVKRVFWTFGGDSAPIWKAPK